jgi:beta-xylosidase
MTIPTHRLPEKSANFASPIPGYFADPSMAVYDGRYYVYPTTDGTPEWGATSFRVFSSSDLREWTDHGEILRLGQDVTWAHERAWAPAIAEGNGRYYFYFTGNFNIGVAVGETPIGPFRDIGRPLVAAGEYSGSNIDPSVFVDVDGKAYLYWGNTFCHAVPLNADMISFDPSRVIDFAPAEFREAPHVHERNGLYYLSWSVDDTRDENYRVRYATGPSPLGPWTDRGLLLAKDSELGILATGHHSIAKVPGVDEWIIAYHRFAVPGGDGFHRELVFDRLKHLLGGRLESVAPALESIVLPLGTGPGVPTTQSPNPQLEGTE